MTCGRGKGQEIDTPLKLVLIEWVDSYGCSASWQPLENCQPEEFTCRSVGWLLHDGEASKVIVPHVSSTGEQGCGDMSIPTRSILKIVELAPFQKRFRKLARITGRA